MPYSIETEDGIVIDSIPDDVAPDSQVLKDRVASIRANRGSAQTSAPQEAQQVDSLAGVSKDLGKVEFVDRLGGGFRDAPQPTGFLGGLIEGAKDVARDVREAVTGTRRSAAPDVAAALAENRTIYDMPEANQLSFGMLKSALGGLTAGSEERAKIFAANFPGLTYRLDEQGTVFLRSPTDGKEYVIEPGLTVQDVPRAALMASLFTPAGRAVSIPAAIKAGGATQAAIEMSQQETGGEFNPGEVLAAAATGPAGQVLQRVGTGLKNVVQNLRGKLTPVIASGVRSGVPTVATNIPAATNIPVDSLAGVPRDLPPIEFVDNLGGGFRDAPRVVPTATPIPVPPVPPVPPVVPDIPIDTVPPIVGKSTLMDNLESANAGDVLNLARKAAGYGPGSSVAKARLIDMAQVNPKAADAAKRIGVEVPFDVLSDNPQVRSAVGLTRSQVGSEAEAAWETTLSKAIQRADEISQEFDAAFIEGRPATGLTSQKIMDNLTLTRAQLVKEAKILYNKVDAVIPADSYVSAKNLEKAINEIKKDLGPSIGDNPAIRKIERSIKEGMTYGGLSYDKSLLGERKRAGTTNEYSRNLNMGLMKKLESAAANDQLDAVEYLGGKEIRRQLRGAHLITAKQKALEKRIIGAFGKEIDGSVAQNMQSAISTASKGDAAAFNRLMKVVPKELRRETVATALASVTSGKTAGRASVGETVFSPTEYTKVYRGLRSNPPVYSQIVKIMGPEWAETSLDLYAISKRLADANARVLSTGKANQLLGEMGVNSLFTKVMSSGPMQRIATGVASGLPGGGFIAPDIIKYMAGARSGVSKASKLFLDPDFQKLAIEQATTGKSSESTIRKAAMSQAFKKFSDQIKLPKTLDARIQWLQSAMQAERQLSPDEQPEPQTQPVGQ